MSCLFNHASFQILHFFPLTALVACLPFFMPSGPVLAQVRADGTTNTVVRDLGAATAIEGGNPLGKNLFHSFSEFSVPSNNITRFENVGGFANIFARVTGNQVSMINGILTTAEDANLYFLNPNGITFGRDATVILGGSLIASTGEGIHFSDGKSFSVKQPNSILSVSVPVGVQIGKNPGPIVNNGANLAVPGKTISLIGGDINFNDGNILAPEGRVDLFAASDASVALRHNDGQVTLATQPRVSDWRDIRLLDGSQTDWRW